MRASRERRSETPRALRPLAKWAVPALIWLVAAALPVAAQIPEEPPPEIKVISQLDWGEDTVILDAPVLESVIDLDEKGLVFRFPKDRGQVARLRPGQIVVFRGSLLRKVRGARVEGEVVRLETEDVPLTEALRNARISMQVPMGALFQSSPETASLLLPPLGTNLPGTAALVFAGVGAATMTDKFCAKKTISGFEAEACLERKSSTDLEASLEITKKVAGKDVAKFSAKGSFGGVLKPEIRITDHQLDLFEFRMEDFHSKFEVKVAALEPGGKIKLQFPPIIQFPFLVGGAIPVVFKVSVYTSLETILPSELASVDVKLDFSFDGDYGFSYTGGPDVTTFASKINNVPTLKEGSLASESYTYMKFNVGLPRIEFGIFGNVLVPWFQNAISLAGYYTGPFQPASCRELKLVSVQAAGYDFGLLGFSRKYSRNMNHEPMDLLKVGDCD